MTPSLRRSFGGGKIIDVGKLVAHKMGARSIVVPSVASTDAPCTALSVLYKDDGAFDEYVFFNKVGWPVGRFIGCMTPRSP